MDEIIDLSATSNNHAQSVMCDVNEIGINESSDNISAAGQEGASVSFISRLQSLFLSYRELNCMRWLESLLFRGNDTRRLLDDEPSDPRRKLTTFTGVFAPVALSMFSTMLFLRIGFVIGQAGLFETLLQMILAYIILLLTVFSICAISTNGAVEAGGAYYMISRALGPEFGGSIGFLFFVANILGSALYVTAVAEAIMANFGTNGYFITTTGGGLPMDGIWWKYLYATLVLLLCLVICLTGGSMFAKTNAVILGVTVICTLTVYISIFARHYTIHVAIPKENDYIGRNHLNHTNDSVTFDYTGLNSKTFKDNLYQQYGFDYSTKETMSFATVFAVLFSSVTGIMNGANMSGELKDPGRSLPRGTLGAVAFTFCTYIILMFLVSGSAKRELLLNDYIFLQDINLWPPFVLIGIFATTLSAALGNLIGASRILEALAIDQLYWFLLNPATKRTKGGNPYVAVLISWFLVQAILLIGSLNHIARITSVFFLLAYASTNLACTALDLASAPNFRPTFKYFSWHTSLLGIIGSMIMCFFVSPLYTSIAIIIMLLLAIMLHFRSFPTQWGSISQALIFHQVRKYLLMLDIRKSHVKYWRPQMLLLVANPRQSVELMDFVNDIKKGGLYVLGHVKVGDLDDFPDKDPAQVDLPKWMQLVDKLMIKAFVELTLAHSVAEGFQHLVRTSGLGGMKINTVCLGFYDSSKPIDALSKWQLKKKRFFSTVSTGSFFDVGELFDGIRDDSDSIKMLKPYQYVKMIDDALKMQKNIMLCRHFNSLSKAAILARKGTRYIDVWPVNFFRPDTASYFDNTCLFLLQLATVINMVPGWKSRTCLRVFLFVNTNMENVPHKEKKLAAYLRQLRILAKIQTVSWESIQMSERFTNRTFDMSVNYEESRMQEYNNISDDYLSSINRLISSHSSITALTFLYLPWPPQETTAYVKYLKQLDELSVNLPPTVFVHGLHPVITTTL